MSEWSSRRINEIAAVTSATTYLEVGVAAGDTFFGVDLPMKDAVDPHFAFATADHATETQRFFETTSDRFFASRDPRPLYDIIFLDGLHTFEQTFRDFCSALSHAHGRTVFLIDDTVPSDVYSSLPDPTQAIEERALAVGGGDTSWHGDVYKMVLALHDFFPALSYATITDGGNPQTLVWREPRADFAPRYDNLEKVSRTGYFDLSALRDVFQFTREAEAMARMRAALDPG